MKRFTWLKKDVYAPQIVITDSLIEKDLTPIDCYELLNELNDENQKLKKENGQLKQVSKELREDNKRLQMCVNDIYTIARLEGLE